MRKLSVLVFALVAVFALGSVSAVGAKKVQKVKTNTKAQYKSGPYDPYAYYDEAVIKGKAKGKDGKGVSNSERKKCTKKRKIVIKSPSGDTYAKTKTDKKGKFSVEADDAYTEPGQYKVKAKKVKKGKVKCLADNDTVQVDPYTP